MTSCVHNISPSRGNTHQVGSAKHRVQHFLKCVVELIDQNGFASVHFRIPLGLPNFGLWRFARTASWMMHSLLSLDAASHACPVPSPEDSVAPALRFRHMAFCRAKGSSSLTGRPIAAAGPDPAQTTFMAKRTQCRRG